MQCTAKRQDGEPCRQHALAGANVCIKHGGHAPQVRRAAARRVELARAERAVARFAAMAEPATPVADPLAALAALAGEATKLKDILAGFVAELESLRYQGVAGEQVRGELILYGQALDRCNTILATYGRLGVDERLAKVEEAKLALLASVINAVLADQELALTNEQRAVAPAAVVRHLEAVRVS